jgi:para-aminobenzoate synthetase/4-amino-4-deoxychorismate lyase
VASGDWLLRHKTTNREVYNRARAARPDTDDVLLVNERGEITESTIANVVAEIDGVRVTPPVACGLLPGVFRAALLESGEVRERVLSRSDLAVAPRLWLINSLREWIPATLVGPV